MDKTGVKVFTLFLLNNEKILNNQFWEEMQFLYYINELQVSLHATTAAIFSTFY